MEISTKNHFNKDLLTDLPTDLLLVLNDDNAEIELSAHKIILYLSSIYLKKITNQFQRKKYGSDYNSST